MPKNSFPALADWNMYAGGTSAAPGKHGYDLYVEPGQLSGGVRQYTIDPVSYPNGRHRGYRLSVAGSGEGGLHRDLGLFRSPGQAVTAARAHFGRSKSNPGRGGSTFKSLPIGARFRFESESSFPYSGMARGPWIKTSARGYTHADTGGRYRVGSSSVEVERENPGGGRRVKLKNFTGQVRLNPDRTVSVIGRGKR